MKKLIICFLVLTGVGWAQAQAINQVQGPTPNSYVYFYDIASTPQYVCQAQALQGLTTWYKSSATLTSIAVATNVGTVTFGSTTYLWPGARIIVAGSATTALNASYVVTATSGSTATITTVGVSDGTYTDANLTVSTQSPLLNNLVWAIQITRYISSSPQTQYWAGVPGTIPAMNLACSARATY